MSPAVALRPNSNQPVLALVEKLFSAKSVHRQPTPVLRPIRVQDRAMQGQFFVELSDEARFDRFMGATSGVSPSMLRVLSDVLPGQHEAVMAVTSVDGNRTMVAEARYVRDADNPANAEFAITVGDQWQRQGLARRLMKAIEQSACENGIEKLIGITLKSNHAMITLANRLGYRSCLHPDDARATRLIKHLVPECNQYLSGQRAPFGFDVHATAA